MSRNAPSLLDIPDFSLVVLIGATGSGKSAFAKRWFAPTEVISSDDLRALVSDDETDQSVSADAFELVAAIAEKRLKHRRLAVIDATNVRAADRARWVELARRWHALPVAVVLDPGLDVCVERNRDRLNRDFGPGVPKRMISEIRRGLRGLAREGFRQTWTLSSVEAIDAATVERRPLWTDLRGEAGPFDIIGDIHGCADELERLLARLGYGVEWRDGAPEITAPDGRKLVFVGDLVDRGPDTPRVLRLVMAAVETKVGFCVQGNHDRKLARKLGGANVQVTHGLQDSLDQLAGEGEAFSQKARRFLENLRSHLWLDGGRLAVAHAGLKEEMIGRGSSRVRDFALYGETNGETDEFGLPARLDWAAAYRGPSAVVYGHTPVLAPEWVNNTLCVDTGCVFGGALTALRWPEREQVAVPAARVYSEPVRPLAPVVEAGGAQNAADRWLDHADVSGRRWIETRLAGRIPVAQENAMAALEIMSRFALAPQWLVYLPPTMSPVETSAREGWLERPEEAFAFYRERGLSTVVLQEKHMGSRALIALCREESVARRRFGVAGGQTGAVWTRTGRPFLADGREREALLARLREGADRAGLWAEMESDWLLFDAEIMPWSAKAGALIEQQYAPVAAAGRSGLAHALAAAERARARGIDEGGLAGRLARRADNIARYAGVLAAYDWPAPGPEDLRVAPFHLLASDGRTHFDRPHAWHMDVAGRLAAAAAPVVAPTRWRALDLSDPAACIEAAGWWEEMTAAGGEGMVVKPADFIVRGEKGLIQPALKVRGREYLRLIYGPDYDLPENLERLRKRGLGRKRALATKEFALGAEALERFVAGAPLRRTHECVFATLALESEPVDPRL